MGDLRQIRILMLKSFDCWHLCLWNTKNFCKALMGTHPSGFKSLKTEEDIELELESGL